MQHSFKSSLALGFLLVTTPFSFAVAFSSNEPVPRFCESAKGVREIKAFINCQMDPHLGACAGLETYQAGRFPVTPLPPPLPLPSETMKKQFVDALAAEFDGEWSTSQVNQLEYDNRRAVFKEMQERVGPVDAELEKMTAENEIGKWIDASGMTAEEKEIAQARLTQLQNEINAASKQYHSLPKDQDRSLYERKLQDLSKEKADLYRRVNKVVLADPTSPLIRELEAELAQLNDPKVSPMKSGGNKEARRVELERRIAAERKALVERFNQLRDESNTLWKKMREIDEGQVLGRPIEGTSTTVDTQRAKINRPANANIPAEVSAEHRAQAEAIYNEIVSNSTPGKPLAPEFVENALKKNAASLFPGYDELSMVEKQTGLRDGLWGRMKRLREATIRISGDVLTHPAASVAGKAVSASGPVVADTSEAVTRALAARSTIAAAASRALASRPAAALLGAPGMAAAIAAEVFFYQGNKECDDKPHTNADASDSCKPRYEVNQQVVRFLDQPEEEQEKLLRSKPEVCDFYEKLHGKLFKKTQFEALTCKGKNGFILRTKNKEGEVIEHNVSFNEKKDIRRVELARDGGPYGELRFNPDGTLFSSNESPANLEKLMDIKMYIFDAKDCCLAGDEPHGQCLSKYNSFVPAARAKDPKKKQSGNVVQ